MSSYSLTEALKHSRHRTQQLRQQQVSPPVVSVHKSRSEPSGIMLADAPIHPPPRRRNDEVVSVPIRPWHSPRGRANDLTNTSPPSFSLESGGVRRIRQNQNNFSVQQQPSYLTVPHSLLTESGPADDSRSVGTEMCVSDTISQDPSVSENYLCERSARISHSNNCSNSTHQLNSRRGQRSSRRQRGGDSGRHHHHPQSGKGRNVCGLLPTACSGPSLEWPSVGRKGRSGRGAPQPQHSFGNSSGGNQYLMSSHLSGLFVNANCLADQRSPSQRSERTDPEFGCEDLKVRGQWHDSLSNGESATQATMTDDHTRSAEVGTDLSALTLSRMELSSTQAVDPRRLSNAMGAESPAEDSDDSQMMQAISYQQMHATHVSASHHTLISQHQHYQHQHQHQHQHQPQYQPASHAPTTSRQSANPALASQQQQQQQHRPNGRQSASPPLGNRQASSRAAGSNRNRVSQNSSNSSFSLNQSELSTRESATAREEVIPASDDLVHLSVISCSEAATRSEAATTAPAGETEADGEGEEADTTLRAESDRLAASILATEEPQLRLASLGPRASQAVSVPGVETAATVSVAAGSADGISDVGGVSEPRRSSRFGRLKTPEICKRSFLSVLRHSIAQGHVSHRAKMKPAAAAAAAVSRAQAGN